MTIVEELRTSKTPLTVNKVAEVLGCHIQTVYDWAKEGKIHFMRIGRRIKFDPSVIADWLEQRTF